MAGKLSASFCVSHFRTYSLAIPVPTHDEDEITTVGNLTIVIGPFLVSYTVPHLVTVLGHQRNARRLQVRS